MQDARRGLVPKWASYESHLTAHSSAHNSTQQPPWGYAQQPATPLAAQASSGRSLGHMASLVRHSAQPATTPVAPHRNGGDAARSNDADDANGSHVSSGANSWHQARVPVERTPRHRRVGMLNANASQSHLSLRLPVPQGQRRVLKMVSREGPSVVPEAGEEAQPSDDEIADHIGSADILFQNMQARAALFQRSAYVRLKHIMRSHKQ